MVEKIAVAAGMGCRRMEEKSPMPTAAYVCWSTVTAGGEAVDEAVDETGSEKFGVVAFFAVALLFGADFFVTLLVFFLQCQVPREGRFGNGGVVSSDVLFSRHWEVSFATVIPHETRLSNCFFGWVGTCTYEVEKNWKIRKERLFFQKKIGR